MESPLNQDPCGKCNVSGELSLIVRPQGKACIRIFAAGFLKQYFVTILCLKSNKKSVPLGYEIQKAKFYKTLTG